MCIHAHFFLSFYFHYFRMKLCRFHDNVKLNVSPGDIRRVNTKLIEPHEDILDFMNSFFLSRICHYLYFVCVICFSCLELNRIDNDRYHAYLFIIIYKSHEYAVFYCFVWHFVIIHQSFCKALCCRTLNPKCGTKT